MANGQADVVFPQRFLQSRHVDWRVILNDEYVTSLSATGRSSSSRIGSALTFSSSVDAFGSPLSVSAGTSPRAPFFFQITFVCATGCSELFASFVYFSSPSAWAWLARIGNLGFIISMAATSMAAVYLFFIADAPFHLSRISTLFSHAQC